VRVPHRPALSLTLAHALGGETHIHDDEVSGSASFQITAAVGLAARGLKMIGCAYDTCYPAVCRETGAAGAAAPSSQPCM